MQRQYDAARFEMAAPAGRTALRAAIAAGAAPLDETLLQQRIAAPLGASFLPPSFSTPLNPCLCLSVRSAALTRCPGES